MEHSSENAIYSIVSYLELPEIISLSSTCKTLHHRCMDKIENVYLGKKLRTGNRMVAIDGSSIVKLVQDSRVITSIKIFESCNMTERGLLKLLENCPAAEEIMFEDLTVLPGEILDQVYTHEPQFAEIITLVLKGALFLSDFCKSSVLAMIENATKLERCDFSGWRTLSNEDIRKFFVVSRPNLTLLEANACSSMTECKIPANASMTTLKLEECPKLTSISTAGSTNLEHIYVNNCSMLVSRLFEMFIMESCPLIQQIHAQNCENLVEMNLSHLDRLTLVDFTMCTGIVVIRFDHCIRLSTIELAFCEKLEVLELAQLSALKKIDLSLLSSLHRLRVENMVQLEEINICGCESLFDFDDTSLGFRTRVIRPPS